jgi:phage-related baseplate assembly protein
MSLISITDLLTPVTRDQANDTILNLLEAVGLPARSWNQGGVARTVIRVVATAQANFSTMLAAAIGGGFLEKSSGAYLILLAFYVYGVSAISATFASGQLTLINAGGGIFTYGARQARFSNPITKVVYTNVADFTLGANTTLTIDIEAVTAGAAGSATPGTINNLVTTMLSVTCTNALAVIGVDAEKDADLRARCLTKLATRSVRGPRDAYAYASKSAKRIDGTPVNINRVAVSPSSSTGQVTVYCASPSGAPDSDDLDAAAAAIESDVRPEAVTVSVLAVTEVPYNQSITIWAQSTPGVTAAAVQDAVEKAIADFIAVYPIGGLIQADTSQRGLFGSGIASVIGSASPAKVFSIEGSTPGSSVPNLALLAGQAATNGVTVHVQMAA